MEYVQVDKEKSTTATTGIVVEGERKREKERNTERKGFMTWLYNILKYDTDIQFGCFFSVSSQSRLTLYAWPVARVCVCGKINFLFGPPQFKQQQTKCTRLSNQNEKKKKTNIAVCSRFRVETINLGQPNTSFQTVHSRIRVIFSFV